MPLVLHLNLTDVAADFSPAPFLPQGRCSVPITNSCCVAVGNAVLLSGSSFAWIKRCVRGSHLDRHDWALPVLWNPTLHRLGLPPILYGNEGTLQPPRPI